MSILLNTVYGRQCTYFFTYFRQVTQGNLPDLNDSSFFYSFGGREAMDASDMEDLDRQRRADLMRDTIMDKLAETGEKDKLKDMLRDRLILSGKIHA